MNSSHTHLGTLRSADLANQRASVESPRSEIGVTEGAVVGFVCRKVMDIHLKSRRYVAIHLHVSHRPGGDPAFVHNWTVDAEGAANGLTHPCSHQSLAVAASDALDLLHPKNLKGHINALRAEADRLEQFAKS